jgi:hypothetical protein|uniref:Uncharacterized protein n=1 Tax=Oryza sativa subsp. japonica TaxID=39947 RepID=Q6ZEY0_ORYSJ|nr:hypothetical protein [Oryza sativa Japonica Group]BAD30323.1 hypothetical protein [Oryza sativa Japonica Group]
MGFHTYTLSCLDAACLLPRACSDQCSRIRGTILAFSCFFPLSPQPGERFRESRSIKPKKNRHLTLHRFQLLALLDFFILWQQWRRVAGCRRPETGEQSRRGGAAARDEQEEAAERRVVAHHARPCWYGRSNGYH